MSEGEVPHADFYDERIDMAYWYPKVRDLDVPTPETQPLPLERRDDGPPEWDTDLASEIVENLGGEAFARSGYKSAQMMLSEGSHVQSPDPDEVDRTLHELLSQHVMMSMPVGESLWLREWLDVDFCWYCRDNLNPETRVFIRDGEFVCYHPRLEGFDRAPDHHREMAEEFIESGWDGEHRDETVQEYAEIVAEEFDGDGWFSVDFVMDRTGNWWLTDMALDAVYDMESRGKGGYHNISEHPGDCPNDLENQI